MKRRAFLQAAGAAAAGRLLPADELRPPVVDTHLHCFAGKNDARFPYHPQGPYQPDEVETPEMLLQCMADGGVDYAIVVHPKPYQDDHRYLEYVLRAGSGRLKGTCLFFADRPETYEAMPALAKKVPLVAARIHAYLPERLPPFGKPELRKMWKMIGELGLAVQLHLAPRHAPGFEPLIEEFRETRVIIDHLGRPFQGTPEEHEVVVKWARFPNTIMKIASLPTPTELPPTRDVEAIIRRLVAEYGADRMICGGGFGAGSTGKTYQDFRADVRRYLGDTPAAEQAKIFGGTAAKLFGFGV